MRFSATTLPSPSTRGGPPGPLISRENLERKRSPSGRRGRLRAVLAAVAAVPCLAGLWLATHWPYSERIVVSSLEETLKTPVSVQRFRRFYFPRPGCEAEGLVVAHPEDRAGAPALATVRRMTITGRYSDLLYRPHHLEQIELEGLQVRVGAAERNFAGARDSAVSRVTVESVLAKDATFELARAGQNEPLRLELHELRLSTLAAHRPVEYEVGMRTPMPHGELSARGTFGPWEAGQLGRTPLYGTAQFQDVRLDDLPGIGGTLYSEETFGGTLEAIDVRGRATSVDFHLKTAQHRIALTAEFAVMLDALEGNAQIRQVTAKLGQTPIRAHGSVAKNRKLGRRETELDFAIPGGRVEDALWLFNSAAKPPMMGPASGSAHVLVPKFGKGFLKELELNGKFEIADGRFQQGTQAKVNRLSARAAGVRVGDEGEAPGAVVEALDSDVTIRNGSAFFPELFFMIRGAHARFEGTYDLESHQVKMEGNLWTLSTISQESDGIKSVLLKPIDPLFKRKHAGARVGVTMTGTVDEPQFGVVLTRDKKPGGH